MLAYAPRPIRFLDVQERAGFALKRWWIDLYGEKAPREADWAAALELAEAALPKHGAVGRPDVGFLIQHRGAGADYLVLGWWDRENELPTRVVVRDHAPGAAWRPAAASESFCVWDLQVIGFERDAYVATVLAPDAGEGARERYLAAFLSTAGEDAPGSVRPVSVEASGVGAT